MADAHGSGPVSYTHLDVYKRQGLEIGRRRLCKRLALRDIRKRRAARSAERSTVNKTKKYKNKKRKVLIPVVNNIMHRSFQEGQK